MCVWQPPLKFLLPHRFTAEARCSECARSTGNFYVAADYRLPIGTFKTAQESRARLRRLSRPWCDLNFQDLTSTAQAKMLTPHCAL
jgi:hypothetical protein